MSNRLALELIADANNMVKTMEQAQRQVTTFMKAAESAGQSLGAGVNSALNSFVGLAKGGASAAGVLGAAFVAAASAATYMAIEAGRQAEELSQLSSVMGIGADKLQEYDVLLNRVGLGGQDLSLVMKTLSTKMEEAKTGTGAASDRFRQLGIDITKVTSTDDLIRKVAESVSHFSNGTGKAAAMADLLGKSGLKFIPAFEGGAAAIDEAAAASKRLGATLSGIQIETLGKMDDSVDDLGLAWKRFSQQLGAFFAPAVEIAVEAFTKLLAWGSDVFHELGTASATLAIRFTAMGEVFSEVASQVFSTQVFNAAAWSHTLDNIKRIDAEAAALIAKRRELANAAGAGDSRSAAPALIDSAKVAAQAQAAADAQLKASESLFKGQEALAQANLANFQAHLQSKKSLGLMTDAEMAQASEAAAERMSAFTIASLETQIRNYQKFYQEKLALFGTDEKSLAERAKFEIEATSKSKDLLNQLQVAQVKSDTTRVQSSTATAKAMAKETNDTFARMLEVEEQTNNLQFGPATISEGMKKHQEAVENLIRLMPELNHHEAALLAMHNQQAGHDAIVAATEAYKDRNRELELGLEYARADFQLQQAWYSQAPGLIGQADLARQKGFALLLAENDMRRKIIDETIFDEERKGAAIFALDKDLHSKRMGLMNQFPTFWEQQLNAIVASNAFSLSAITSNFNSATAAWMQGQGDFQQFWAQTQTTLLTSALQMTEQWLVQLALAQLREMGMVTAQEAAKTAAESAASAGRIALATGESASIVAIHTSMETAKTAATTVAEGARLAISLGTNKAIMAGVISTLGSIAVVGNAALATMGVVVGTVSAIMAGIGSALIAGVFTAPIGALMLASAGTLLTTGTAAVAAGVGALQASLGAAIGAAMAALATPFASGGIATGPTLGLMAEAGSAEAAIPLNDRGAAFMQRMMGLGGGSGTQQINLYVDGRLMTKQIVRHMPDVIHTKLGYT